MTNAAQAPRLAQRRLSSVTLREQVYGQLKVMIMSEELRGGVLYSVAEVAEMFSVSRTPVREALLALAADGLMRAERNRGFRLVALTQKEVDEIFELRLMLDVPAMRRAAQVTPRPHAALAELRKILARNREAAEHGALLEFLNTDRELHVLLADLCGNPRLTALLASLRDQLRMPGLQSSASRELLRSHEEHAALLEAVSLGDAQRAGQIATAHAENARERWK